MMETSHNQTIPLSPDWAYLTLELGVSVVSIFGNSLVILVFFKFKFLRSVTNYYVISLATADLLVGLIGIPCAIAVSVGLPENFQACLVMSSLLMLLCTGSILSLVAITVDRGWAIMNPLRYPALMTRKTAQVVIAICWTLASVIGLLPLLGWNKGRPLTPSCFFMQVIDLRYLVFIYFATILAPSAFMACVYAIIFQAVRKQIRRLSRPLVLVDVCQHQSNLKSQGKAARNIAIIIILFVISWIPLYTINTIVYFCPECVVPPYLLQGCIVLSHLNSVWNPALYAWGMRDFREALRKLFGYTSQQQVIHKMVVQSSPFSSHQNILNHLAPKTGTVV